MSVPFFDAHGAAAMYPNQHAQMYYAAQQQQALAAQQAALYGGAYSPALSTPMYGQQSYQQGYQASSYPQVRRQIASVPDPISPLIALTRRRRHSQDRWLIPKKRHLMETLSTNQSLVCIILHPSILMLIISFVAHSSGSSRPNATGVYNAPHDDATSGYLIKHAF